ncbi:MAG: HAMP domain-containing histidine kinase [Alphaproteobacteria bacterium]|nr:HAMP domain-containing histidine kinase [Alphaproteobacteria bacterium]
MSIRVLSGKAEPAAALSAQHGALGWLAATVGVAAALWPGGPAMAGWVAAAMAAPAVVTLILAPQLDRIWAIAVGAFAWTVFAFLAATFSGGAASPAAFAFLVAPALAALTGDRAIAADCALFSIVGYVLAAAGAPFAPAIAPAPVAAAIGAAGGLLAAFWATRVSTAVSVSPTAALRRASEASSAAPVRAVAAVAPSAVRLDADMRIVAIGARAAAMLGGAGLARGAAFVTALATHLEPDDLEAVQLALGAAAAGDEGRAEVRLSGQILVIDATPDDGGALALVTDVTPWAAKLAAMEQDAAAAREARAARSRQTAELSHELRTPLSHILGFTEIMQRELYGPLPAKYQEYVGLIQTSGRNLLELIGGLMDLSRLDGGRYVLEPERFDVRDIAAEVVRLSSDAAARKAITLEADLPDDALEVDADPRALRQMLVNLTTNALKFTPGDGRVIVRARQDGDDLVLEVQDNGPGIAPEDRARLGQAFERGAGVAAIEGVGLGLALTRGFAELHGGGLAFLDAPGGGALVRVTLPVVAQPRPGM